jgi:hypothetical protein
MKSSSLSGGAIAGVVIGVLAVAIIAALASFFLVRRKRQSPGQRYGTYNGDEKRKSEVPPVEIMDSEPRGEASYK